MLTTLTSMHFSQRYFTPSYIFAMWLDPPGQMEKEYLGDNLENEDNLHPCGMVHIELGCGLWNLNCSDFSLQVKQPFTHPVCLLGHLTFLHITCTFLHLKQVFPGHPVQELCQQVSSNWIALSSWFTEFIFSVCLTLGNTEMLTDAAFTTHRSEVHHCKITFPSFQSIFFLSYKKHVWGWQKNWITLAKSFVLAYHAHKTTWLCYALCISPFFS